MKTTMHQKAILLVFVFSVLTLNSCYYNTNGSGITVEEKREVGNFSGIRVTSGINIRLSQGSQTRVLIKADEDLIDNVETEVVNGELQLSVERKWFRFGHVEAEITFIDIDRLDVSAGSDVESEHKLKFDNIEIEASSGSDLELNLEANMMRLRTSSGSDADLRGSAREFIAKASSGSDIDAYDLEVEKAELECSSGSDVRAWVTGSMTINASSGSDIFYRGNPKIENINTSSGSDVHRQ